MLDKTTLPTFVEAEKSNSKVADNIPISGHYNDTTLITKNGALIKTIEITGEAFDISLTATLPELINKGILESVDDYKISVHIHTIRSRKDIMPQAKSNNAFCNNLNDAWCKQNNFDKQLINTIYISFTIQGDTMRTFSTKDITSAIFYGHLKKNSFERLQKNHDHLDRVIAKFNEICKKVSPRLLALIATEEGVISEPLTFFHHLIQLESKKVFLPIRDASEVLSNCGINFGFNEVKVTSPNHTQYAALYTFKDYYKMPPKTMDAILHIGSQFVLTQEYIFTPKKYAIQKYKESAELVELSGDTHLEEIIGYKHILNTDSGNVAAYCKIVTSLLIHSDMENFFRQKITQITNTLHQYGILCVREDFFLPRLFWVVLPGNTQYTPEARSVYMDYTCIGEYASIHHSASGSFQGSKWGAPVTLVRTSTGTPYFFNFHDKNDNGSMVIIGPGDTGKSTIARFLITQSQKFDPLIYYLDLNGESTTFLKELDAELFDKEKITNNFKLNAFDFLLSRKDPAFLTHWLQDVFNFNNKQYDSYKESLDAILKLFIENNQYSQKILMLKGMLEQLNDTKLSTSFDDIFINNTLFSDEASTDKWSLQHNFNYFSLEWLNENPALLRSYLSLFFLKLINDTKNNPRPKIFYINDLRTLFKSSVISAIFLEVVSVLQSTNSILISNFHHDESALRDKAFIEGVNSFGSKIFTSDKNADKYFKRAYNLTEDELFQIKSYSPSRRMFLLKQNDTSVILALKLDGLKEQLKILESKNAKISD